MGDRNCNCNPYGVSSMKLEGQSLARSLLDMKMREDTGSVGEMSTRGMRLFSLVKLRAYET